MLYEWDNEKAEAKDELLPDYGGLLQAEDGVRGKYAGRNTHGHSVTVHYDGPPSTRPVSVELDADIAAAFPDSLSVNSALRALLNARIDGS